MKLESNLERALPYRLPRLNGSIAPLEALALNLRWTWTPEVQDLFRRLDPELWSRTVDNPVLMLLGASPKKLASAARNAAIRLEVAKAAHDLQEYLTSEGWYPRTHPDLKDLQVAYFSMEFGLTECLPFYAGGLGILAGDHLKSASSLDVPLFGVGLLWQGGYFRQALDAEGWQMERHPNNVFAQMPLQLQRIEDGSPLIIQVALPGRNVDVSVWRADVGRIPLLLLDTNLATNGPSDCGIASDLYGGGQQMRLEQEIILGIGGLRALAAMGIRPDVCHMNESHAAFVALEGARQLMQETGLAFEVAYHIAAAGNVFTTHTPVPAGFDVFPMELIERYFADYAQELGISMDTLRSFGRSDGRQSYDLFNMAALAVRSANSCNGVSQLHAEVSRKLFSPEFARFPEEEVPITAVTNGIHTHSWTSREITALLHQYLGEDILEEPDASDWDGVANIPDEALWAAHTAGRHRLVEFARQRLNRQLSQRGMSSREVAVSSQVLHPDVLTIGFARRFAKYKRSDLFLRDRYRLKRLLLNEERPVQFVLAGKAHPADDGGKRIIQEVVEFCHEVDVRGSVVFLEDYDMATAAAMVQGIDVWLNNPRRPLEASGTSGMKVLPNGGLNLSVLDGWWAEAYSPEVGWAIGNGEVYEDPAYGDAVEADFLYNALEREIIPLFYDRDGDGLPHGWIAKMKRSMTALCYRFNTNRMVHDYTEHHYIPAAQHRRALSANGYARAKALSDWSSRVRQAWNRVRILRVDRQPCETGTEFMALVRLNGLKLEDVRVEVYRNQAPPEYAVPAMWALNPAPAKEGDTDAVRMVGLVPKEDLPAEDYTVRILPFHPDATLPINLPLIIWEK